MTKKAQVLEPPATKPSDIPMFGMRVDFSNGEYLIIDGWGLATMQDNLDALVTLGTTLMRALDGDVDGVGSTKAEIEKFASKQFTILRNLIQDSVVGGSIDFDDLKGLGNFTRVVEAVLIVNEVVDVAGKLAGLVRQVTKTLAATGATTASSSTSPTPTT